jgi:hypothetical protein
MKLSLRVLELLFDSSTEELIDKVLTDKWNASKEDNGEVLNYTVPDIEIDNQLDYILSDPELVSRYSAKLSQNPLIVLELGKTLSESMIIKFEKLMNIELEKKKNIEFEKFGNTEFEKKMNIEIEKNPKCTQRSRKISNSMNIIAQDTENKDDNHCKKDHCKKSKTSQHLKNKEDRQFLQCTAKTTAKNGKSQNTDVTPYNIKTLEESDEWIDIETTAKLFGKTRQAIAYQNKQGKFQSVNVPKPEGGLKTFINVNSLPIELQQKWKMQLIDKHGSELMVAGVSSGFTKYPEDSRRRAFAKETIIKTYLERRELGRKQGLKLQVVDMYFQKDLDQKLIMVNELKILGKFEVNPIDLIDSKKNHILSIKVVKKWLKMWNDAGHDITVLCDKYDNCGTKRSWPREIEGFVAKLAINPNNYTYKHIYDKTYEFFGREAPSYHMIKHFVKTVVVPQNKSLQAFVEGKKAIKKIAPYVPRVNDAFPGDIWISDGYENKFLVYSPYHKHPKREKRILLRPVVVYWLDTATELVTGYAVSYSERFDVVISSFDHAVSQFGVPKGTMTDNAGSYHNVQTDPEKYAKRKKDSQSKRIATKLLESGFPGFFQNIGVERVTWVTPGNPQAKKIEPYNHKIFDVFEKDQFTYLGKTPDQRPERMNMTNHMLIKKHGDMIMSWEQYLGALEAHIEKWNNTKRKHLNDLSAKEYYLNYNSGYPFKQLSSEERFIKMTARKTLKLRGKQLELLGNIYRHPSFEAFIDTEIQVIYNVRDLHSVHIATIDGKLLEGKAHIATYGSQTNKEMTADAIHARNYYEKQNKAVYYEIIQQGGLTNKLKPAEIDQAYDKAMHHLEAEDSLKIDQKIKEIHKNSSMELDQIKSKKDTKPKPIHEPKNPRPFTTKLQKESLERIAKEMENPKEEQDTPEARAKKLVKEIQKSRGIPRKRRMNN